MMARDLVRTIRWVNSIEESSGLPGDFKKRPRSSQSFLLSTLTLLLTSWFLLCILYIWDLFFWGRGGGGTKAEHSYWGTSGLKSWITLINLLNLTINFLEQDKERTSQNTTYNAVLCISVTFQEKSPLFGNIFIAFLSLRKWFGP